MDTLTHIVIGGCIGEIIAGKQLGKKAIVLGAIAQNIPDIDFIASSWLPTASDVLAHRGFTHSILFAMLATPLLAYISVWAFKPVSGIDLRRWMLFWGIQIFIHIFIDAFNAYGTGWFEPFSHRRVSFNALYVADPLFSVWPAIAMTVLAVSSTASKNRMIWAKTGVALSCLYLLLCITFKTAVDRVAANNLKGKGIAEDQYFTTPTPLNNLLWYIVARTDSGYYVGYRSVFDKTNAISLRYVSRNDSLLSGTDNKADLDKLLHFSQGYHVAQMWHDTLVFNDLRFGEQWGGLSAEPRFAFYYYLQYPDDNKLVVQRGRFAGWDRQTLTAFIERIKGK